MFRFLKSTSKISKTISSIYQLRGTVFLRTSSKNTSSIICTGQIINEVLLISFKTIYLILLCKNYQLIWYLLNRVPKISDNKVIDTPIIKRLKVLFGFKIIEKNPVPIGIKSIATVKIIPKTLPRNSLSTSLWTIEKNWILKIDRNKLNSAGDNARAITLWNIE